jgi:hypothetical protein
MEEWYFPIDAIVNILTDTTNARRYRPDLKPKLKYDGSEVCENVVQLKLPASDR